MEDLQYEVERLLRRMEVEELRNVATHLQVQGAVDEMTLRQLLRGIQTVFDEAEDEETRGGLLRNLPMPNNDSFFHFISFTVYL